MDPNFNFARPVARPAARPSPGFHPGTIFVMPVGSTSTMPLAASSSSPFQNQSYPTCSSSLVTPGVSGTWPSRARAPVLYQPWTLVSDPYGPPLGQSLPVMQTSGTFWATASSTSVVTSDRAGMPETRMREESRSSVPTFPSTSRSSSQSEVFSGRRQASILPSPAAAATARTRSSVTTLVPTGDSTNTFNVASVVTTGRRQSTKERQHPRPWTPKEHSDFLEGIRVFGRGSWQQISENYVPTRTPMQLASHAQKYYARLFKDGASPLDQKGRLAGSATPSYAGASAAPSSRQKSSMHQEGSSTSSAEKRERYDEEEEEEEADSPKRPRKSPTSEEN